MQAPPSVLFVCLGNICRSPLAEGVFRQLAEEAGVEVEVDSAGTGSWNLGQHPDNRAQAVAGRNGVDIGDHISRLVTPEDFRRHTHLVAMDASNLANLRRLRPADTTAELSLLMSHAPETGVSAVPGPYEGEAEGFNETYRLVEAGARGLLSRLQNDGAR